MDNSIDLEPTANKIEVSIVKVKSIFEFITPAQVLTENKEVE
ncbi:hypothetical protein GCM10023310_01050 [Paenibacillus vulneris]|uniref:Uncharacterized protein n=1 Tax=Paenibacillus vulneris TaxID=1133364 RepID=A0ABW3UYU6_9BACL